MSPNDMTRLKQGAVISLAALPENPELLQSDLITKRKLKTDVFNLRRRRRLDGCPSGRQMQSDFIMHANCRDD
jgi:hypothetical protein